MTKVSYANLKLKTDTSVETFDFNGSTIEVLKYLPIEDKYSLVNITLQEAKENGIYNPVKLDMYFNLNLVYTYTNVSFTDKQREDEAKLYDTLMSNGFIDNMLEMIPESEYEDLMDYIETAISDNLQYSHSVLGVINEILNTLPAYSEELQKLVANFNKEDYKDVLDFAKAVNADRPVA